MKDDFDNNLEQFQGHGSMLSKRLAATFSGHCRLSYTEIVEGKLLDVASVLSATMPWNIANKLCSCIWVFLPYSCCYHHCRVHREMCSCLAAGPRLQWFACSTKAWMGTTPHKHV